MRGFTLIELLIVLGVISILALVTIPAFRAYGPNIQLLGSAREIITDLRYIQQLTITEQTEYCLKVFPLEKKYQTKQCNSPQVLKEKILPEEIKTLSSSGLTDGEVKYNPYGAVAEAGTITLENIKSEIKNIQVKPSGFVEITD